jgi:hypothetical protein
VTKPICTIHFNAIVTFCQQGLGKASPAPLTYPATNKLGACLSCSSHIILIASRRYFVFHASAKQDEKDKALSNLGFVDYWKTLLSSLLECIHGLTFLCCEVRVRHFAPDASS